MVRAQIRGENGGNVAVLAGFTQVATIDLGIVVAGDWIVFGATIQMSKVGAAGQVQMRVGQASGTAVIRWPTSNLTYTSMEDDLQNSVTWQQSLGGIFKVTTGGTVVLELEAASANSNCNCAPSDGGLQGFVLIGT